VSAVRQFRAEGERPLKVPSPPAPTAVFTGVRGRAGDELEDRLSGIVRDTSWLYRALVAARSLHLPEWCIGAGADPERRVWNALLIDDGAAVVIRCDEAIALVLVDAGIEHGVPSWSDGWDCI